MEKEIKMDTSLLKLSVLKRVGGELLDRQSKAIPTDCRIGADRLDGTREVLQTVAAGRGTLLVPVQG